MPKISIIVPVYNVEKYLKECLDSIVNQTLKDIEIICVNDGSTDNSLDIIKDYASRDERVKYIDKQNSGYGNSMNQGLDMVQGEYIGIVESDDFIKPEMYEELYSLAKETDADIVKGGFYHYFTKTDLKKRVNAIPEEYANKVTSAKENPEIISIYPSIWSAVYKNSFIKNNNIRFLETPGASYQDMGFTFKTFALAKRVYLTTKPYLYYRQDNASSSVNSKGKVFILCEEYKEIERFIDEHPEIQDFAREQMCVCQYIGYKWNLKRIADEFKQEFTEMFSDTFKNHKEHGLLKNAFYKTINEQEADLLINDYQTYLENIKQELIKEEKQRKRRNMFSLRINKNSIRFILLGQKIINWERE